MNGTKKWYASLGVHGSMAAIASGVMLVAAAMLGQTVGVDATPLLPLVGVEATPEIVDQANTLAQGILALTGGAAALWGRLRAQKTITR